MSDAHAGTQCGVIVRLSASGHQLFRVQTNGPIDSYPAIAGTGVLFAGGQSVRVNAIG